MANHRLDAARQAQTSTQHFSAEWPMTDSTPHVKHKPQLNNFPRNGQSPTRRRTSSTNLHSTFFRGMANDRLDAARQAQTSTQQFSAEWPITDSTPHVKHKPPLNIFPRNGQ